MYVEYALNLCVTALAGRTRGAGTVAFSATTNGTVDIAIELNDGWRFGAYDEVTVQDYDSEEVARSSKPALGQFAVQACAEPFVEGYTFIVVGVELDDCHALHAKVD